MHHAVMAHSAVTTGYVGAPKSNFANQMGSMAVAIFFIISSYLFCSMIANPDRKIDIVRFFEGRVMRIVPLYVACVAILFAIAFYVSGFHLLVKPAELGREIGAMATFGFVPNTTLNGVGLANLLGQRWTLSYEWMLYMLIPFLAFAVRKIGTIWAGVLVLALLSYFDGLFAFFAVGAAAVELQKLEGQWLRLGIKCAGLVGLPLFAVVSHQSHNWIAAVPLTFFFVALLQGGWGFRWLESRPLALLGLISYSVYLTHGISGYWVESLFPGEMANLAFMEFAKVFTAIIFATLTYQMIEKPFMSLRPTTAFVRRRVDIRPVSGQIMEHESVR
jgi:peptidoglycan/LPS O-acetylase OafA/YrhL